MHITKTIEFPANLAKLYQKAIRYEWLSFFYMCSVVFFLFLTAGQSQTMKTVLYEDVLSLIPPISFIIASKLIKKPANKNFPYGFHKVPAISYLASSLSLFVMGFYLIIDGLVQLLSKKHPIIDLVTIGNHKVWLGYLMILALLWKSIPNTILGHIKHRLAKQLYDKILYTDSKMNKADWMTGFASIIGILGIKLGYWWADSAIAMLIALNIIHDGFRNFKLSVLDLIDEVPKTLDGSKTDPLLAKVKQEVLKHTWVKDVHLRFRDEGHVFFGEIFVVPKSEEQLLARVEALTQTIKNLNWRLHDIVIVLVPE